MKWLLISVFNLINNPFTPFSFIVRCFRNKMEGRKTYILRVAVGLFLLYLVLGQTCERYWLLHEEMCYRHFTDQVSYLEAKKQCKSARARLVANLTDDLEGHLLGPREQYGNSTYWCKTDGDDHMFLLPGLERRKRSTSCCFIQNMQYEIGECDELRGYICEKNTIPLIHICLQNTTTASSASDWESARRYCQCNGGDLYSFNDTAEKENFLQTTRGRNQSMWIGLRREEDSKAFLWSDGTPIINSIWDGDELSTDDNSKLCVAYVENNTTWEVVDCNSQQSFICKSSGIPHDVSSDETGTETEDYSVSLEESTVQTNTYEVTYDEGTTGTNAYNVSYYESSTETNSYNFSYEDSTMESAHRNGSAEFPTTANPSLNASLENSTAETAYISACSPMFENCYVAGAVVGTIIFLTAVTAAIVYSRLKTKKERNEEVPVELLNVHSYKDDVAAKTLAEKIKKVIA